MVNVNSPFQLLPPHTQAEVLLVAGDVLAAVRDPEAAGAAGGQAGDLSLLSDHLSPSAAVAEALGAGSGGAGPSAGAGSGLSEDLVFALGGYALVMHSKWVERRRFVKLRRTFQFF